MEEVELEAGPLLMKVSQKAAEASGRSSEMLSVIGESMGNIMGKFFSIAAPILLEETFKHLKESGYVIVRKDSVSTKAQEDDGYGIFSSLLKQKFKKEL